MTGQIPPYGHGFRRESTPYHPVLANTVYVLKDDDRWYIRSDKTSHKWQIYRFPSSPARTGLLTEIFQAMAVPMGREQRTLTQAMDLLLRGIVHGYYVTEPTG